MKIHCPKCNVECEPYGEYETIGKCPQCGDLLTTKRGDEIEIKQIKC